MENGAPVQGTRQVAKRLKIAEGGGECVKGRIGDVGVWDNRGGRVNKRLSEGEYEPL